MVNITEQAKLLGKKISVITISCGASLIFASLGAGIGATLFRPSIGQWIGKLVTYMHLLLFVVYNK